MTAADLIADHEGFRGAPYNDSTGHATIGYGTLLPLTKGEALLILQSRLDQVLSGLQINLPWFSTLDAVREAALLDMGYNLGVAGLLGFKRTLAAIEAQDWQAAHDDMLESKWASQVGSRAIDDAFMILTGLWPGEGGVA